MSTSYSRIKAVHYAQTYALSTNTKYHTFTSSDCTNFVSQALYAGGWPMIQGEKKVSSVWYYDFDSWFPGWISPASYTWAAAANFHSFLSASGRAKKVTGAEALELGDVVQ